MEAYVSQIIAWSFGVLVLLLALLFLPFFIALVRGHQYKWIIFVLCFFGLFGIPWLIALVWAIWPKQKSLADPILGNPIGTGARNVGDTLGAVRYGKERGYRDEMLGSNQVESPTKAVDSYQSQSATVLRIIQNSSNDSVVNKVLDPKERAGAAWTIGRDPSLNELVFRDQTVSRQHARLSYKEGAFFLEDLGSANGTYLNNSRISPYVPVSVSSSGVIFVGRISLRFSVC